MFLAEVKQTLHVQLDPSYPNDAAQFFYGDYEPYSYEDVEFETIAMPMVQRVFANLIANDLVPVRPMGAPVGVLHYMNTPGMPDGPPPSQELKQREDEDERRPFFIQRYDENRFKRLTKNILQRAVDLI